LAGSLAEPVRRDGSVDDDAPMLSQQGQDGGAVAT